MWKAPGCLIWFTGLSGAGKTTLANGLYKLLFASGYEVEILDGDFARTSFSRGLGFSLEDRIENLRRIAFVANLLAKHGVIVLVAAIAPYKAIRDEIRRGAQRYVEVYVNAPLAVCEQRDPKGLYHRARAGELAGFTGIGDPYEPPEAPEIECRTASQTIEESVNEILQNLLRFLPEISGLLVGSNSPGEARAVADQREKQRSRGVAIR